MALVEISLSERNFSAVQHSTVDKILTMADGDTALLYLYLLRQSEAVSAEDIARALHLPKERIDRAIHTLTQITLPESATREVAAAPAADAPPHYTTAELCDARRDEKDFSAICQTAESALGRTLPDTLLRCLYTGFAHYGLSGAAIIELLLYLKGKNGQLRTAEVKKEIAAWADLGIQSGEQAQAHIAVLLRQRVQRDELFAAIGIEGEAPTASEERLCDYALRCGFSTDAVALAVRRTFAENQKRSLNYTRGILKKWHEKGLHSASEILALEPENREGKQVTPPPSPFAPADAGRLTISAADEDWAARVRRHTDDHSEESN